MLKGNLACLPAVFTHMHLFFSFPTTPLQLKIGNDEAWEMRIMPQTLRPPDSPQQFVLSYREDFLRHVSQHKGPKRDDIHG